MKLLCCTGEMRSLGCFPSHGEKLRAHLSPRLSVIPHTPINSSFWWDLCRNGSTGALSRCSAQGIAFLGSLLAAAFGAWGVRGFSTIWRGHMVTVSFHQQDWAPRSQPEHGPSQQPVPSHPTFIRCPSSPPQASCFNQLIGAN